MAQWVDFGGIGRNIKGGGIVVVLVILGIALHMLNIEPGGSIAIGAGIIIGVSYGVLGFYGIIRRYRK